MMRRKPSEATAITMISRAPNRSGRKMPALAGVGGLSSGWVDWLFSLVKAG